MNAEAIKSKNIYYPPGGILIWIIVFIELITFLIALSAFVVQRNASIDAFQESQQLLNRNFGLINTVFLLTAGFFMAESVRKLKGGDNRSSHRMVQLAILFGVGFLVMKCIEYYQKISMGIGLEYSDFYMYYWLLTGFHFIHVLVGVGTLAILSYYIRSGFYDEINMEDVETGAVFWHMCDLIWLILFPILYLL